MILLKELVNMMVSFVCYLIQFEINLVIDILNGKEINHKVSDLKQQLDDDDENPMNS